VRVRKNIKLNSSLKTGNKNNSKCFFFLFKTSQENHEIKINFRDKKVISCYSG